MPPLLTDGETPYYAPTLRLDAAGVLRVLDLYVDYARAWVRAAGGPAAALARLRAVRYRDASEDVWYRAPELVARGWGKCEDLAAAWCGVLREQGVRCAPHLLVQPGTEDHVVVRLLDPVTVDGVRYGPGDLDVCRAYHGMAG